MAGFVAGQIGRIVGTGAGRTITSLLGTITGRGLNTTSQAVRRASQNPTFQRLTTGTTLNRGRQIALRGGGAIAGGAALGAGFEAGSSFFDDDLGAVTSIEPGTGRSMVGGGGFSGAEPGMRFGTTFVTRTWTTNPETGFPFFMKLADGRIVVTRRDGSLKSYRPVKPIVLSRKPTVKQLVRAQKTMNRFRNDIKKEFRLKERD